MDPVGDEVAWVGLSTPLSDIAQRIISAQPRVVVVASPLDGPPAVGWVMAHGIITDTEILRACAEGQDFSTTAAATIMVEAATLQPGDTPPPLASLEAQQDHPYLLVTGNQGQLLGVIALTPTAALTPNPGTPTPSPQNNLLKTQQALQTQRNYNHLITTIISRFVEIRPSDLDQEIRHTLHLVRQVTQMQGCYLSFCQADPTVPDCAWGDGDLDTTQIVNLIHLPWSCTRLQRQEILCVPNVATLPEEAALEQAQWQGQGIGAMLILPLVHKATVIGAISLVADQPVAGWRAETIQLLQVLGKMIVATQQRLGDERQLQESEERLRLALSATNQGLYDVDLTTGEVVVSPEYATMLGYDPASFRETEAHWRTMLHPEDQEAATAIYDAYVAGKVPEYKLEFRLRTRAGQWKWILSLGKIVAWDGAGHPLRMLGTHTDIDDLKRAEQALRASEIRFRTFMDNSPMVAWIVDPETHRLEYTSRGWFRNYAAPSQSTDPPSSSDPVSEGPTLPSPLGQSLFDLFAADIAQVYAHHNHWVVEHNESLEVVEPGIRPDHSPGEFLTFKFPLPQPQGHTLVGGVAIDITERNRTEQRLALQSTILVRIARKEPLGEILTALALALEDLLRDGLCSIMFCGTDGCLHAGVAPSLPAAYDEALEGTQVGEAMGSCGTAAVRRQPVIVEDIATDPLWADFRDLPLAYGLRSCWSIPVFASDGPVLATLAIYHREPRQPYPHDLDTLQLAANLAKVAIEQEQATQALEQLNRELEDRVVRRTEALEASKARLKEAQQVAHLGWWEMDAQTRQITWSEEVMALLGHTPGESCTNLRPHLSEGDWERFNHLVNQAIDTGAPCTADLAITRHDGSQGCLFIKATCNRATEGDHRRIFGIAMDVSERWVMQNILRRSEERTRATLLALPDLIFRVNREGIYLDFMASPTTGNLVDPDYALGKHLSDALPLGTCQDHLAQKLEAIHQTLETQTVQCYEQVITLHGDQHHEEVRVAPCGQDEVVFFIRDISDRKRTELALQQTNQELAHATRMKDEFLANMSHELRTPLNAILGMAEVLQDEVFGPRNESQQRAIRTIEHSGTHLLELINDILDLAKIEAGQMSVDRVPVAVSYLCSSSVPFVQAQAQAKGITLRLEVPDTLPDVLGDERRLRQVLINLLNNAVKFTPDGGTVTLAAQRLEAQREGEDPRLRLTVSDTGIGIAPADLDQLFQPFVQIDSTLNRQYSGTGLGLALVKRMVDLQGGQVQVRSTVGVGSHFSVDLPATVHAAAPVGDLVQPWGHRQSIAPTHAPGHKPLLLLVDDNEANLSTFSSYLGARGYRLEIAKTGEEAVAMATQHRPDLILMDIQMPGIDGLEAAQRIRTDPALAGTIIVALTALTMPQDRDYYLAHGIDDCISTPVKLRTLAESVRTLLNHQAHSL